MAEAKKGGTTWLKYGCFGCLGFVGLLVLVAAGAVGIALMRAGSAEVAERVLTPDLPAPPPEDAATPPSAGETPDEEQPAGPEGPGKVTLDLSDGEFRIGPAGPGEPLRVEATYDRTAYELEERLDESGEGWTYHVGFRRTASWLMVTLAQVFGGTAPEVRVLLPVDEPLALDFELTEGGYEVDLGGLWLTSADFELHRGGFELRVDEPTRVPMERLTFQGSMGGFRVSKLGNASPRRLDLDFSMGGMDLDLRGRWVHDSEISVTTRMGGAVLRLPRNVAIEGLDVDRPAPDLGEVRPPTLRFTTSTGSSSELEIID